MTKKRKAELCDGVIKKFYGDCSYFWRDLHGNNYEFNDLVLDSDCKEDTSPNTKYFVIQPIINLLLEDGVLQRMDNKSIDPYLSLTDKGNAMLPYLNHRGYVTIIRRGKRKSVWIFFSGAIIVATFLILIYDTWFNPKYLKSNPQSSDTTVRQTNILHETPLDTNKEFAKKDSGLVTTDTTSKQNLQPTKPAEHDNKKKSK